MSTHTAELGRSWALEGALTTIDTSKVKNVFSKAPATMEHWEHGHPPLPLPRATAVAASPCLVCGTGRKQPSDTTQNAAGRHVKLYSWEGGLSKKKFFSLIIFFFKNDTFKNFFV